MEAREKNILKRQWQPTVSKGSKINITKGVIRLEKKDVCDLGKIGFNRIMSMETTLEYIIK